MFLVVRFQLAGTYEHHAAHLPRHKKEPPFTGRTALFVKVSGLILWS